MKSPAKVRQETLSFPSSPACESAWQAICAAMFEVGHVGGNPDSLAALVHANRKSCACTQVQHLMERTVEAVAAVDIAAGWFIIALVPIVMVA